MEVLKRFRHLRRWTVLLVLTGSVAVFATPQDQNDAEYQIHISDIKRNVNKNILGVPHSADCSVYWKVFRKDDTQLVNIDEDIFDHYHVVCQNSEVRDDLESGENVVGNFYTFPAKKVGVKFSFVVEGYIGNNLMAVSDTAWTVVGKLRADQGPSVPWYNYIPFNGRIPLDLIGREHFFDEATNAGKVAFHLIWNFLLIGGIIWIFFCFPHLSLGRVFPLGRGLIVGVGYDEMYKRRELKEFKRILDEWRNIVKKANENIRQELGTGQQVSIADIEGANAKFWRDVGSRSINRLIERLDRPGMNKFPAVRIIKAGLENHELGGFHWVEVSKEVDRAIENRASSELEKLRRKSMLDWLWNLGTLAPLLGLFGTATGISHAFAALTFLPSNITQSELVKSLAGGIYEALWTTIEGLFVGLFLMILYYYYNNKLNWIYSKWEDLYVYVAEKL